MNKNINFYSTPYLLWMSFFFLVPTMLIVIVSFVDNQSWSAIITMIREFQPNLHSKGVSYAFTQAYASDAFQNFSLNLSAYKELFEPRVVLTIWRTFFISLIAGCIAVLFALPSAQFISSSKHKDLWLLLLVLPFWTNFLLRIYAWITILGNNGVINHFLLHAGIINKALPLLYNNFSVTMVSIYVCLPFAIIPIYSAIEKFDHSLLEAAEDLGATPLQTFFYIYFPGIKNGIASAFIFSFINTFGNYAVAKLVGGQNSYVLGSLVVHNATVGRNMPLSAAISTVITVVALVLMMLQYKPKEHKNEI